MPRFPTGTLVLAFALAAWIPPRAAADPVADAYRRALASGDQAAAYRAQSFLMPPYGDDPNAWHGITIRRAVNGRIGRPRYPFTYQDMADLRVRALYARAGIARMERAATSELDLIRRIADWANRQWGHMRPLPYASWDALEILDRGEKGDGFWCEYKAALFVQACNAAGLTARIVGINRKDEDSHMVAEVYSNQFRKWMLVDAWWNCYYERNGVPLSAIEFHQAAGHLDGIEAVFGPSGKLKEYWALKTGRATSLPHANQRVAVATDPQHGLNDWYYDLHVVLRNDHTVHPQPNHNTYVDGFLVPPNYRGGDWRGAQLHWVDEHTPPQLTAPNSSNLADFEWPLNEVRVDLQLVSVAGEKPVIAARFTTRTPSFARFDLQVDGTPVSITADPLSADAVTGANYTWALKPGENTLHITAVNVVGRAGFPSDFILDYDPAATQLPPHVTSIAVPNPGFEERSGDNRPAGWSTITSNQLGAGEFTLDGQQSHSGREALRVTPARDRATGIDYAFIVRSDNFRVNPATDVVYSVWLKAAQDDTPVDIALLDGTYKGHGTYAERVQVGREWKRYDLKCRLHNQLTTVWVGFKVYHGTVWADDASVREADRAEAILGR